MRKIIFLLVWFIFLTKIVFWLNISVNPWESKSISFPQELQSINFSKTSDFSVKTLEWWIWKDVWSSLSNYSPLKWYIVNNFSWDVLDIGYTYKPNISLNSSLIQRDLKAGWNLVWISQQNTIWERVRAIFGFGYSLPFSQMIDFTSSNFDSSNSWNDLDSTFHISWKSEASSRYIFENKAYAVFNNVDSLYSWVQNFTDWNGYVINEESIYDWEERECDEVMDALGICEMEESNWNEWVWFSLSPQTPVDWNIVNNSTRNIMLAVDVTAWNTDLPLNEIFLKYTWLWNSNNLTKLAVYLWNAKISKWIDEKFNSENENILEFYENTIILANETKTLFITVDININSVNEPHQITLISLKANSNILPWTPLVWAKLNSINTFNPASVEISSRKATENLTLGQEGKIAWLLIHNEGDIENILLKYLTFKSDISNNIDIEDNLVNIKLLANGFEIANNLNVNADEEIVIELDYIIYEDTEFELIWTIISFDSNNPLLKLKMTDAYAVWVNSNLSINVPNVDVSDELNIEIPQINALFEKSNIDEITPDSEAIIGNLILNSNHDYLIDTINIRLTGDDSNIEQIELYWNVEDVKNWKTYSFEDINIQAWVELNLDLVVDIDEFANNGDNLIFDIEIIKVIDENNGDKEYSIDLNNLDSILPLNNFSSDIDIKFANLKLTWTDFNNRTLVVENNVEIVLYRWKINVGDVSGITLDDINFQATMDYGYGNYLQPDFDDLFKEITLNVGGVTVQADNINVDGLIEFNNLGFEIEAGSNNIEILLTATLSNVDINNGSVISVLVVDNSISIEDTQGNDQNVFVELILATTVTATSSTADLPVNNIGVNATILNND